MIVSALAITPAGVAQPLVWRQVTPGVGARADVGMVFDTARGVTVLFGGRDNTRNYGDTWEWDGATWTRRATTGPLPRNNPLMAFDESRGVTVLHGGVRGDTWEWDGIEWVERAAGDVTNGRVMAYDARRGVTVVVGAVAYSTPRTTWEWDGVAWHERLIPGPGYLPLEMIYDTARGVCVLTTGSVWGVRTWEFDGEAWTDVGTAPTLVGAGLAYDRRRGVSVLCGGSDSEYLHSETYERSDGYWTQANAYIGWERSGVVCAYDALRGVVVLHGGRARGPYDPVYLAETWEYDGVEWVTRDLGPGPVGRSGAALAYDANRQVIVLYGGGRYWPPDPLTDTWEWDGSNWRRLTVPGPGVRSGHGMAFDRTRRVTVLFGGSRDTSTWEWDGTYWRQHSLPGPDDCAGTTLCFDEARNVSVLFTMSGETWELDGQAWNLRTSTGPQARNGSSMAYDAHRSVCVLFGGVLLNNGHDPAIWEWDGVTWTSRVIDDLEGDYPTSLSYDVDRRTVVIRGNGTARWDGQSLVYNYEAEPGLSDVAMAYDEAKRETIMIGNAFYPNGNQTWALREPECLGDLNFDGFISLNDLARLLSGFGTDYPVYQSGDLDGDLDVDLADLALLLDGFGSPCP
ncbi:MAG: hypothetical protein IT450_03100 [Phycisphaerales bacterium]|nr:hypothetical protein [Phycisphaerales bacterium]